jgi:gliding motility-associated-like protein
MDKESTCQIFFRLRLFFILICLSGISNYMYSASTQYGFLGPDQTICSGDTIVLHTPQAFSYLWSTGERTRSIQVSPVETTIYWAEITNLQGQIERDTLVVSVLPTPVIEIHPSDTTLLPGEAILLRANGGMSYLWSTGETDNKLFVEPVLPQHVYSVIGTAENGCSATAEAVVRLTYTTIPAFTHSKVCFGDTTQLTADIRTNDTIVSISWDLNGDLTFDDAVGEFASYALPALGEHLIGIKVVTKYSETPHITYLPVMAGTLPIVDFDFGNACIGSQVEFIDRSKTDIGTTDSRIWDFGNGDTSTLINPGSIYSSSGRYTVQLNVITDYGCKAEKTKQITVQPNPEVRLTFEDGTPFQTQKPYSMYRYDELRLIAAGNYDSVFWNDRIKNKQITLQQGGKHTVRVYKNGCAGSEVFYIDKSELAYNPDFEIQNILTPNGDGYNDTWKISILDGIQPAKVTIYTRAGLQVFEASDYQNDWSGMYNNNPLPAGSYFYVIEGAHGELIKGVITLIR